MAMNLSWFLTALSLIGNVFIIQKKMSGQVCWMIANTGWVIYFASIKEIPSATLFSAYLGLCIWGVIKWSRDKKNPLKN